MTRIETPSARFHVALPVSSRTGEELLLMIRSVTFHSLCRVTASQVAFTSGPLKTSDESVRETREAMLSAMRTRLAHRPAKQIQKRPPVPKWQIDVPKGQLRSVFHYRAAAERSTSVAVADLKRWSYLGPDAAAHNGEAMAAR